MNDVLVAAEIIIVGMILGAIIVFGDPTRGSRK
jgi:hypothetical protein